MNQRDTWTLIKLAAAHLYGDFGCQTGAQAMHKGRSSAYRARHVAAYTATIMAALATHKLPFGRIVAYGIATAITHYIIDTLRMRKWLDQLVHAVQLIVCFLFFLRSPR